MHKQNDTVFPGKKHLSFNISSLISSPAIETAVNTFFFCLPVPACACRLLEEDAKKKARHKAGLVAMINLLNF
ncbi:MAG: hypothetical protein V4488_16610 [Pseudomonadota bacterium]